MATKTKTETGTKTPSAEIVEIREPTFEEVRLRLVGTAPLVMNRLGSKIDNWIKENRQTAEEDKTDGKQGRGRGKKEAPLQVPEDDFHDARYRLADGRDGIPARNIKKAMITAGRLVSHIKMTEIRMMIHVNRGEDLLPLEYDAVDGIPVMRTDWVRVGSTSVKAGTPARRYRPQYNNWSTPVTVRFLRTHISLASVINLMKFAGIGGLGEDRPEKSGGQWGTFDVVSEEQWQAEKKKAKKPRKKAPRKKAS